MVSPGSPLTLVSMFATTGSPLTLVSMFSRSPLANILYVLPLAPPLTPCPLHGHTGLATSHCLNVHHYLATNPLSLCLHWLATNPLSLCLPLAPYFNPCIRHWLILPLYVTGSPLTLVSMFTTGSPLACHSVFSPGSPPCHLIRFYWLATNPCLLCLPLASH
ncbi:hypothetical protein RRG08_061403 [Elysia crispata]|uniref:Uncharacterized protein n=1 Tax=Elysia crispata TaxID=231223 RepID=A0AAE1E444_9GAST|nr:hypothetical protein RRG08_061403 [Elysia crispata]